MISQRSKSVDFDRAVLKPFCESQTVCRNSVLRLVDICPVKRDSRIAVWYYN
jgi:hypothetical protein